MNVLSNYVSSVSIYISHNQLEEIDEFILSHAVNSMHIKCE